VFHPCSPGVYPPPGSLHQWAPGANFPPEERRQKLAACPCEFRDTRPSAKVVYIRNVTCATLEALRRSRRFEGTYHGNTFGETWVRFPTGDVTSELRAHCPVTLHVCTAADCADPLARRLCPGTCRLDAHVCAAYATDPRRKWLREHSRPLSSAANTMWSISTNWALH